MNAEGGCGAITDHKERHCYCRYHELVVLKKDREHILNRGVLSLTERASVLLYAEEREELEAPHKKNDDYSEDEVCVALIRNTEACKDIGHHSVKKNYGEHTYVGADTGNRTDALSLLRVFCDSGHKRPIRKVIDREEDGEEEIGYCKKDYKRGRTHIEVVKHQYNKQTRDKHTRKYPRLEFTPFSVCIVNNCSHKRVVNRVEYSEYQKKCRNNSEVEVTKTHYLGKMRHKVHADKRIHSISADSTETKAILIASFLFCHSVTPHLFSMSTNS